MRPPVEGPDFLCIGMQLSGTRWLFDQLDFHDEFWMPPIKELHYFDSGLKTKRLLPLFRAAQADLAALNAKRLARNHRRLDDRDVEFMDKAVNLVKKGGRSKDVPSYISLFQAKRNSISGDITPAYAILPDSLVAKLGRELSHLKIVFLLRDPVARVWSHVKKSIARSDISHEQASDWQTLEPLVQRRAVLARSYPSRIWRKWSSHFPEDQIRYFFFDDVVERPAELRASIIAFLGADPDKPSGGLPAGYNRKSAGGKLAMPGSVHQGLVELFRDELLTCADLFGGPARAWPSHHGL